MLFSCGQDCGATCVHAPIVQTYAELASLQDAVSVRLDTDMEALAFIGTHLDSAFISTRNVGALLSDRGGYASTQITGSHWRQSEKRIAVRVSRTGCAAMSFVQMSKKLRLPHSLLVFNQEGYAQHRIELTSPSDLMLIEQLKQCEGSPSFSDYPDETNVVSLSVIRDLQNMWDIRGKGWHMDHTLVDGGARRFSLLPHVGHKRARRIVPGVIDWFLAHLVKQRVPVCRTVPGGCLMQSATGLFDRIYPNDALLAIEGDGSLLMVDRNQIGHVWHTRYRSDDLIHTCLEIYAPDGACLLVLGASAISPSGLWLKLVNSLPTQN